MRASEPLAKIHKPLRYILERTDGTPYAKAGLTHCSILPHIDMWTGEAMLPGWLASQTDMLATDWATTD